MPIQQIALVSLIAIMSLAGLHMANVSYDAGAPQYQTRKIGHIFGGWAYLVSPLLFDSPLWPIVLSGGFTLLLGGARLFRPTTFRGVGGSSRAHALAEIWFPLASTLSLAIGWLWLQNPWLAVVPILYMAWGDAVTGLIRGIVYKREVKGNWGSVGMLVVCLLVAGLFSPYWIAAIGALLATLAERFTPPSHGLYDDNYTTVLASLVGMIALVEIF